MFNFKSKKLNPVTADLISEFEKASAVTSPTERVEALMLLKEETKSKIAKIRRPEAIEGLLGVGVILVGHLFAAPLVAGAGVLWVAKKFLNDNRAEKDKEVLIAKIDTAVSEVVENNVQDAMASPAFVKSLKSSFEKASEIDNSAFTDMIKRTKPSLPDKPAAGK